jgi:uncharacterized membrane protein
LGIAAGIALLPLLAWSVGHLLKSAETGDIPHYTWGWPTLTITNGLLFLIVLAIVRRLPVARDSEDGIPLLFALGAAGLGILLIITPELFALLDPLRLRVNTVLKTWYQAWIFLALSSAYAVYWIAKPWRPRRVLASAVTYSSLVVVALFVLAGLVYPVIASYARTFDFSAQRTVDGQAFVKRGDPNEYAAIQWLDEEADDSSVILEAWGGDYTEAGRVSSRTGIPTILGWFGHEQQWRGHFDDLDTRKQDIELAYNSFSVEEANQILDRYGVRYVYVGRLETQTYRAQGIAKFDRFMNVAYSNDSVTIFEMPEGAGAATSSP